MRAIFKYVLCLAAVLTLCCLTVGGCTPDWAGRSTTVTEGRVSPKLRTQQTAAFHSVRLNDILIAGEGNARIQVTLQPSDEPGVVLYTNDDLFEHLSASVSNGWLTFSSKVPGYMKFDTMSLTIRYPRGQLKEVRAYGAYDITGEQTIEAHSLNLYKQGSGSLKLDVACSYVDAFCGDYSSIVLSGKATQVNLRTAGSAQIDARSLTVDVASVNIRGAGNCIVHAKDTLNIQVIGAGTVEYAGEPEIWKVMFGPANLKQAGK